SYSVDEDNTLVVAAPGVLGNDTDPDGDPQTASLVSGPQHGSLEFHSDGWFTYAPWANYNGPDSFSYKTSDGELSSAATTVSLTVNSVDDPPVIQSGGGGDTATYDVRVTSGAITTVSAMDVDSGDTLSFSIAGGKNAALFAIDSSTGALAFKVAPVVPHNGYEVLVQVSDASGAIDQQLITVNVTSNKMAGDSAQALADTFVFHNNFGSNSVTGFDLKHDFLQFDEGMFSAGNTAAAVLAAAADDNHGNTIIVDAAGDRLIVMGVTTADLSAHTSDIFFV